MNDKTLDAERLASWIGKTEHHLDNLNANQARLMEATMDRPPSLKEGDQLPPAWHWIYFLSAAPLSGLGRDGHPAVGDFLPPVALPRRMWAGCRLHYDKPLIISESYEKVSTVQHIELKEGKSGKLCFVTVAHDYFDLQGNRSLHEEHDIVYREDPSPDAPAPKPVQPPAEPAFSKSITPSTVQLFRYSALTFNGHRIHYDRNYCLDVEGYPGLVFHGPLSATLLAGQAAEMHRNSTIKSMEFRAFAPLYDNASFTLHHDGSGVLWTQTPQGGLAMKAIASFA